MGTGSICDCKITGRYRPGRVHILWPPLLREFSQPTEIKNTVAYIHGWLEVFKKDKRILIAAAGQAQKAVDLVLNRKEEASKEEFDEPKEVSVVS